VTIVHGFSWWPVFRLDMKWEVLDEPLRRLAEQSRCEGELEVNLRLDYGGTGVKEIGKRAIKSVITRCLQNFEDKGRVRIVRVDLESGGESVVYSSKLRS